MWIVKSNWDLIFQFSDFRTGTPATPRTPRPAFNRFWDQEILSLNVQPEEIPLFSQLSQTVPTQTQACAAGCLIAKSFLLLLLLQKYILFSARITDHFCCQFFLALTCLGMIYHFQKDSWKFDDQNPLGNDGLFSFFIGWRLLRPSLLGCPLVFPSNLIFFRKTRQFMGQKAYCPFSTSLYNVHVFAQMYANACQGAYMPPSPLGQTGLIVSTNCLKYAYLVFKIVCPKIWSHKMFGQFYGRNSDSEQRLCCYFLKNLIFDKWKLYVKLWNFHKQKIKYNV